VAKALFDRPCPYRLEATARKGAKAVLVALGEVFLRLETEVLGPREALVTASGQRPVLLLPHGVNCAGHVLHQVVAIEKDLVVGRKLSRPSWNLRVVLRSGCCREAGSEWSNNRSETEEPPTMSASHTKATSRANLPMVPGLGLVDFEGAWLTETLADKVEGELEAFAAHMGHGLLPAAVKVGLDVFGQPLAAEVTEVAGAKGRHHPGRRAVRHGSERAKVPLGGQMVAVDKPRVPATDASGEIGLLRPGPPSARPSCSTART
jgi:hypothetical protein